jgi:hypothetical protein
VLSAYGCFFDRFLDDDWRDLLVFQRERAHDKVISSETLLEIAAQHWTRLDVQAKIPAENHCKGKQWR